MGSKLSLKCNLDDIYVSKEYLLYIDYFIVESLTTVDASYFVIIIIIIITIGCHPHIIRQLD